MRLFLAALALGLGLVTAGASGSAAVAQSTNASPIVIQNTADVDMTTLPLADDAKKAITDGVANIKSGTWLAEVLAGTADGRLWETAVATKTTFTSIADVARQALENCEYVGAGAPCVIFSINGHDARDATGGWPTQPTMLEVKPGTPFDAAHVPFVPLAYRAAIASGYNVATKPRVLYVTQFGDWHWENAGKTLFDDIATGSASCIKANPNVRCILYAVNDTVVFAY